MAAATPGDPEFTAGTPEPFPSPLCGSASEVAEIARRRVANRRKNFKLIIAVVLVLVVVVVSSFRSPC